MEKDNITNLSLDMPFDEALKRFSNVNIRDKKEEIQGCRALPFVKWVGGKRGIIKQIIERLPKKFNNYYEPFLGGGAVFFEIRKLAKKCYISDMNLDLIITYKMIQERPNELIEQLKTHLEKHRKQKGNEYYLKVREQHDLEDPIERSAKFIYLNKTCFNGLFRTNNKGLFNVPMGKYTNPNIVQEENILLCNEALKDVDIKFLDYKEIELQKGDFIYIDPPYHHINSTSFTKYTKLDFSEKNQIELRDFILSLHNKGVYVMLSNSNTDFIKNFYKHKDFKIELVDAPRQVNCKADGRKATKEVLITNY